MFSRSFFVLAILFHVALSAPPPPAGKWFDRIFIMQFENQGYAKVSENEHFKALAKEGQLMTNYFAVTHPSQPNYWSQVAGDFFGWNSDNAKNISATNLVDLMDPAGVTWKVYAEGFPGNCALDPTYKRYARKHNPLISFVNVHSNATRCANIRAATDFVKDIESNSLPQWSYYVPNMDDDGHDTNLEYAGMFARKFYSKYLPQFTDGTLLVVTFDEDDYKGTNQIYTALLGSMIQPGTRDNTKYNHYNLLATVEANWNLGNLGRNDKGKAPYKLPSRSRML